MSNYKPIRPGVTRSHQCIKNDKCSDVNWRCISECSRLSADNIDAKRKRHDSAIEALQASQIEWAHRQQQRINFIDNQLRLERKAETKFTELNNAMREYHEVFGHELPPLPREPVLSDFYTPTDEQHYRELGFIALSMVGIGGVCIISRVKLYYDS